MMKSIRRSSFPNRGNQQVSSGMLSPIESDATSNSSSARSSSARSGNDFDLEEAQNRQSSQLKKLKKVFSRKLRQEDSSNDSVSPPNHSLSRSFRSEEDFHIPINEDSPYENEKVRRSPRWQRTVGAVVKPPSVQKLEASLKGSSSDSGDEGYSSRHSRRSPIRSVVDEDMSVDEMDDSTHPIPALQPPSLSNLSTFSSKMGKSTKSFDTATTMQMSDLSFGSWKPRSSLLSHNSLYSQFSASNRSKAFSRNGSSRANLGLDGEESLDGSTHALPSPGPVHLILQTDDHNDYHQSIAEVSNPSRSSRLRSEAESPLNEDSLSDESSSRRTAGSSRKGRKSRSPRRSIKEKEMLRIPTPGKSPQHRTRLRNSKSPSFLRASKSPHKMTTLNNDAADTQQQQQQHEVIPPPPPPPDSFDVCSPSMRGERKVLDPSMRGERKVLDAPAPPPPPPPPPTTTTSEREERFKVRRTVSSPVPPRKQLLPTQEERSERMRRSITGGTLDISERSRSPSGPRRRSLVLESSLREEVSEHRGVSLLRGSLDKSSVSERGIRSIRKSTGGVSPSSRATQQAIARSNSSPGGLRIRQKPVEKRKSGSIHAERSIPIVLTDDELSLSKQAFSFDTESGDESLKMVEEEVGTRQYLRPFRGSLPRSSSEGSNLRSSMSERGNRQTIDGKNNPYLQMDMTGIRNVSRSSSPGIRFSGSVRQARTTPVDKRKSHSTRAERTIPIDTETEEGKRKGEASDVGSSEKTTLGKKVMEKMKTLRRPSLSIRGNRTIEMELVEEEPKILDVPPPPPPPPPPSEREERFTVRRTVSSPVQSRKQLLPTQGERSERIRRSITIGAMDGDRSRSASGPRKTSLVLQSSMKELKQWLPTQGERSERMRRSITEGMVDRDRPRSASGPRRSSLVQQSSMKERKQLPPTQGERSERMRRSITEGMVDRDRSLSASGPRRSSLVQQSSMKERKQLPPTQGERSERMRRSITEGMVERDRSLSASGPRRSSLVQQSSMKERKQLLPTGERSERMRRSITEGTLDRDRSLSPLAPPRRSLVLKSSMKEDVNEPRGVSLLRGTLDKSSVSERGIRSIDKSQGVSPSNATQRAIARSYSPGVRIRQKPVEKRSSHSIHAERSIPIELTDDELSVNNESNTLYGKQAFSFDTESGDESLKMVEEEVGTRQYLRPFRGSLPRSGSEGSNLRSSMSERGNRQTIDRNNSASLQMDMTGIRTVSRSSSPGIRFSGSVRQARTTPVDKRKSHSTRAERTIPIDMETEESKRKGESKTTPDSDVGSSEKTTLGKKVMEKMKTIRRPSLSIRGNRTIEMELVEEEPEHSIDVELGKEEPKILDDPPPPPPPPPSERGERFTVRRTVSSPVTSRKELLPTQGERSERIRRSITIGALDGERSRSASGPRKSSLVLPSSMKERVNERRKSDRSGAEPTTPIDRDAEEESRKMESKTSQDSDADSTTLGRKVMEKMKSLRRPSLTFRGSRSLEPEVDEELPKPRKPKPRRNSLHYRRSIEVVLGKEEPKILDAPPPPPSEREQRFMVRRTVSSPVPPRKELLPKQGEKSERKRRSITIGALDGELSRPPSGPRRSTLVLESSIKEKVNERRKSDRSGAKPMIPTDMESEEENRKGESKTTPGSDLESSENATLGKKVKDKMKSLKRQSLSFRGSRSFETELDEEPPKPGKPKPRRNSLHSRRSIDVNLDNEAPKLKSKSSRGRRSIELELDEDEGKGKKRKKSNSSRRERRSINLESNEGMGKKNNSSRRERRSIDMALNEGKGKKSESSRRARRSIDIELNEGKGKKSMSSRRERRTLSIDPDFGSPNPKAKSKSSARRILSVDSGDSLVLESDQPKGKRSPVTERHGDAAKTPTRTRTRSRKKGSPKKKSQSPNRKKSTKSDHSNDEGNETSSGDVSIPSSPSKLLKKLKGIRGERSPRKDFKLRLSLS